MERFFISRVSHDFAETLVFGPFHFVEFSNLSLITRSHNDNMTKASNKKRTSALKKAMEQKAVHSFWSSKSNDSQKKN